MCIESILDFALRLGSTNSRSYRLLAAAEFRASNYRLSAGAFVAVSTFSKRGSIICDVHDVRTVSVSTSRPQYVRYLLMRTAALKALWKFLHLSTPGPTVALSWVLMASLFPGSKRGWLRHRVKNCH